MQFIEKVILSLGKSSSYVFTNWEEQTVHNPQKYAKIDKYRCCLKSLLLSQAKGNTVQYKLQYDINLGKSVYLFSQTDKHNAN